MLSIKGCIESNLQVEVATFFLHHRVLDLSHLAKTKTLRVDEQNHNHNKLLAFIITTITATCNLLAGGDDVSWHFLVWIGCCSFCIESKIAPVRNCHTTITTKNSCFGWLLRTKYEKHNMHFFVAVPFACLKENMWLNKAARILVGKNKRTTRVKD